MRGAVFKGDRKPAIENFPDLTPGPGDAVIEMKASNVRQRSSFPSKQSLEIIRSMGFKDLAARGIDETQSIIAGHEPCGVIAAVGAGFDANMFKVGDRVMVFHYDGCHYCDRRKGRELLHGLRWRRSAPAAGRAMHQCLGKDRSCCDRRQYQWMR